MDKKEYSDFARTIPFWFLAIVGLIYASGFLVVTTHLETLGIRDIGSELWKSRYVHIGVLSLVFPAMIISTVYGYFTFIPTPKSQLEGESRSGDPAVLNAARYVISLLSFLSGLLIMLSLELTYYVFAMFVRPLLSSTGVASTPPPEVVSTPLVMIVLIGIVVLIGVGMLGRLCKYKKSWLQTFWLSFVAGLRGLILLAVLWYSSKAVVEGGYWVCIKEILQCRPNALLLMITCWAVMGYFVFTLKRNEATSAVNKRTLRWVLCASVSGPMYYLSLMAFAHSVFPYIPATRGGGDYTTGPQVATISLKSVNESCGATPSSICAGIVEETSSTVYVIEKKLWDPNAWRNRTMHIPQPTAISRDQIVMIEYPSSDVQSSPVAKK